MQEKDAKELLKKYLSGRATTDEKAILETWYIRQEGKDLPEISQEIKDQQLEEVWSSLPIHEEKSKVRHLWPHIAAAASIILLFSAVSYFYWHKQSDQQLAQNLVHDIAPGRNQATLTLANGQKIILTKGLNGKLAQQGNTLVQATAGNAITYLAAVNSTNPVTSVLYNTLSTVRGQQSPYPLVLADGTKVWLDAASSITFPTAFRGNERAVTVTGEAYFEVAHHAAHPFKVRVKNQTIEDIGTHFNINAYDDEPIARTTLIEGSVRVSVGTESRVLKPGQQILESATNGISVVKADTEGVLAWKNNYFLFDGDNLGSIMRKVARWYDLEVVFEYKDAQTKEFSGTISRFKNVSSVLHKLELTGGARFHLEGKKIIITQ